MGSSQKIGFDKANSLFKYLVKYREKLQRSKEKQISQSPFLLLSNLFERNIFSNESCSIDTLFIFGKLNKQLEDDFYISLTADQKLAFSIGKTFRGGSALKFSVLEMKNVFLLTIRIFKTIISFSISILDSILIIALCFSYICFFKIRKNRKSSLINREIDELYSIHYWYTKKSKSPIHYYPDFNLSQTRLAYVSTFFQYRFICRGLIDALSEKNIITALDFVDIPMLIKSIKAWIDLYLFDFAMLKTVSLGRIVSNIDSFKLLNARLYSVLSYYLSEYILRTFHPKSIYLWGENQLTTKAFSIGLARNSMSPETANLKLYTFFGYPYNRNHFPHLTPSLFELKHHVWASNNFMFLDKYSEDEMRIALDRYHSTINYVSPRNTLNRYISSSLDPKEEKAVCADRRITFFSDSTIHDLTIMLFRFYSSPLIQDNYFKDINTGFFLRLHPSLNLSSVKKNVKSISEKWGLVIPRFQFVDNMNENVATSIQRSRICVFANSSIVNQAINQGKDVIAVKTSFMYDPPILKDKTRNRSVTII